MVKTRCANQTGQDQGSSFSLFRPYVAVQAFAALLTLDLLFPLALPPRAALTCVGEKSRCSAVLASWPFV